MLPCPSFGLRGMVICINCNIEFNTEYINKKYCTKKCCNSYHSKNRKKYNIICKNCNNEFYSKHKTQLYCGLKCSKKNNLNKKNIFTKEKYSEMGKKGRQKQLENKICIKDTIRECIYCKNKYNPKRDLQKYCSSICSRTHINILIKNGTINTNINNRGKGEIYFAELCINYFGNDDILCNVKMFKDKNGGLWDSDIIIKSLKICILYDGIFHFKKVKKEMNLLQIQTRDKIKRSVILHNGYTYYTIRDLGKFNKEFVIYEFNLFIHKLTFNKVLRELLIKPHKELFINILVNLEK